MAAYDAREPVTRRTHDRPWVANLETTAHATDRKLLIAEAVDAVDQTTSGTYVDVVTHGHHGHPKEFLYERLLSETPASTLIEKGRCKCGGYVTRVQVGQASPRVMAVD